MASLSIFADTILFCLLCSVLRKFHAHRRLSLLDILNQGFNVWCPLKAHTYLKEFAAFGYMFVKACMTF